MMLIGRKMKGLRRKEDAMETEAGVKICTQRRKENKGATTVLLGRLKIILIRVQISVISD
jgi:hypothetical protein